MVGIYKYEQGLRFTGIIANSYKEAEEYLGNKYGFTQMVFTGQYRNEKPLYERKFVPYYNKNAFEIKELVIV